MTRTSPPDAEKASRAADTVGLYANGGFWGLVGTQFLGAFNDNLFKQILLLLFVEIPRLGDLQWLATLTFSVPFIVFSGYAGYLSDRYSKRRVIVLSKVAEIAIMAAGGLLFAVLAAWTMNAVLVGLLCFVLFSMGAQSAFFGPGKYGILPELLPEEQLPQANGFILMMTFVAIILGSACAGGMLDWFGDRLWTTGLACVGIAIAGTWTSAQVRPVPAASPSLAFDWSTVAIPHDVRSCLRRDLPLLTALIVSSVFWMAAAVVQMAVNTFGRLQLEVSDSRTSLMVASISFGIAVGSVLGAGLSRGRFNTRVLKAGVWGMFISLALLSVPAANEHRHLLGYAGSVVVLILLGVFTGMFAVPLQVFMQARPPEALKGRMIATQNLLNWIGITGSSLYYFAGSKTISALGWPPSANFAFTALLILGIGLLYHPRPSTHEPAIGSAVEGAS